MDNLDTKLFKYHKLLYSNNLEDNEKVFLYACFNGNLNLAKWLLEIKPTINISAYDEFAFHYACNNGYLNVAKWLLKIKPTINISAHNEYAFCEACKNEHLDIVKWLLEYNNEKFIKILSTYPNIAIKFGIKSIEEYFNEKNYSKIYELCDVMIENMIENISENTSANDECIICYEKSNLTTKCNHNYCDECFIKYYLINKNSNCGYCRQNICNDNNKIIIKK